MNLENQKESVTKATKTVADATTVAGEKAVAYTTTVYTTVADSTTAAGEKAVEYGSAAYTSVSDQTGDASEKAVEYSTAAYTTVSELAKSLLASGRDISVKTADSVKDFQVGEKNVGEHTQATVEAVSDKIDVDQISDQVAKLRHQMEGMMSTWKDSFRPSAPVVETAPEAPKKKAAPKKAATSTKAKTTTKKPAAKKAAPKKTASKTATSTKAKTTTKKTTAKKTTK
ncbi:MAG: hypothetical protein ACR2N2_12260 [Acidimicrobiia bacterium]